MEQVTQAIAGACKELFGLQTQPELTRPDEQFGDYSTNVALQLAGKLNKKPHEIAEAITNKLQSTADIAEVSVAGPGFINLRLKDDVLLKSLHNPTAVKQKYRDQEVLVEFGDPNPFKAMHLGHLYTAIVGDVIAHLFEYSGATVKRVSYHGDVGMHVAKCLWAVGEYIQWDVSKLSELQLDDRAISAFYTTGSKAYSDNEQKAEEIKSINESVYKRDRDEVNQIYELLKHESFVAFDEVFKKLGVKYEKRYLESQTAKIGEKFVRENVGKVFEESDGAIVYKGEKVGLHTRVFINSRGLPTYETKDLGLAELKKQDFPSAQRSVIITAHEQTEYFKVMLAALGEIDARLAEQTTHLAHGFLSLSSGKMSSREGNFFAANDLLQLVNETANKLYPNSNLSTTQTDLAALKYTFLKYRIGADIVFDVKESVSLNGNSGPYLQYAHARACSILRRADAAERGTTATPTGKLELPERSLLRKISEYAEVVDRAIDELMPHHITTYLYELAQDFNRFYEHNRVIGDPRENIRLKLIKAYGKVLKDGLTILNIPAPEKM